MLSVPSSAAPSCAWTLFPSTTVPPRMLYTHIRLERPLRTGRSRWNSKNQEIFGGFRPPHQTGSGLRYSSVRARDRVPVPSVTLLERTSRDLLIQVSPRFISP